MAGTLLVALMVLLGLILLSIWIVLYQLIKQQAAGTYTATAR